MAEPLETNQRSKRQLLALALLAIVALSIIGFLIFRKGPTPQDDHSVHVVFKGNANFLIYFVAKEKGFLKDAGLNVRETEMESTNLMVQALAGGQADFNPTASVGALYSAEQNAPGMFKFLYVTIQEKGKANDAFIVKKNSPFTSLKDLKGKKVAAPPGATSLIILKLIFADIGLDSQRDISLQELEPRDQLQALASGQVDALFAFEPLITLGDEKGISRVLETDPMETHVMNPIPIAGGVVTEKFARERPETLRRLQQAMERSIDYIRQHEEESRSILAKAINMPEGTAKRLGINTYWKLGEVNKDFVQRLADLFLTQGALKTSVNTKTMYVNTSQ